MNCTYCEERISDYLEGALSPSDRAELDVHFQACAACSELLGDVRRLLESTFPIHAAPEWLAPRIIANTPYVVRETWADTFRTAWQWLMEPRTAMAVFTAVLVIGWLGGQAGISRDTLSDLSSPSVVVDEAQGLLSGAYNAAVRAYYRSPVVATIYCRIEQLRERS